MRSGPRSCLDGGLEDEEDDDLVESENPSLSFSARLELLVTGGWNGEGLWCGEKMPELTLGLGPLERS